MDKENFFRSAEECVNAHPGERVIPFLWEGEKFWIKKKQSNHRVQAVKYSAEREFYYEIARISIAAKLTDCAPEIFFLTDDYMVLKDGGPTVQHWLLSDRPEAEKLHILHAAGRALGQLHQAGLWHGRPALRDIVWDGERIRFLDWENRTYFHDLRQRQAMDVILLLQGMYRESWMKETFVEAAWQGYLEAGGLPVLEEAGRFLEKHGVVREFCSAVHLFHFKDAEAVEKVCRWFAGKKEVFRREKKDLEK